MQETYQPIACALHDKYEIAIMFSQQIRIKWLDENDVSHEETVTPTDLLVKDGEEFLLARQADDREICVRLDRVTLLDWSLT